MTKHECQCCGDALTEKEARKGILCVGCYASEDLLRAIERAAVLREVREAVEKAIEDCAWLDDKDTRVSEPTIRAYISEEGYLVLAESGGKQQLAIPIEDARCLAGLIVAADIVLDDSVDLCGEFSVDP